MCREVALRTAKAVVAELGVCGFYSKLFENRLLSNVAPRQFAQSEPTLTTKTLNIIQRK